MSMKISPKQYARSLVEAAGGAASFADLRFADSFGKARVASATKAESEKEVRVLLDRFFEILEKNSDLKKLPKIISEIEKINDAKSGVKKAKLITAVELSDRTKKEVAQKLENVFKKKIELSAKVVPEILGGMVIEAGNEILDASARAMINKLKQVLSG